ncbi:MAG: UDP-N-acetylmuramate--L-alanine ligase [Alphaproteobacteria bacterium]
MKLGPCKTGRIHFVGIGGVGMSGIAEVLYALGYCVQGSDQQENALTQRLQEKGIPIFFEHHARNLEGVQAVVVSSAVPKHNPELEAARFQEIPVIRRAEMLAELMRLKFSIAISGTHGKTTTTSLIGALLENGGLDPTVVNGGIVNAYGSNARFGKGDWIVTEADESDGSFTKLLGTLGVVTNIDPEHMEFYGTPENLENAFLTFLHNLPFYGLGILCIDHPRVRALKTLVKDRRLVTYGFSEDAQIKASQVRVTREGTFFDVIFSSKRFPKLAPWKQLRLSLYGEHNVQNALAAIAVAQELEIPEALVRETFKNFSGVKRRFSETGCVGGVTIIDDYAHHPVEIATVLKTARQLCSGGRVIAVCQPHRYSRLADLFDEFQACFHDADAVILLPLYGAGEPPLPGISSQALAEALKTKQQAVITVENFETLAPVLAPILQPGDMVICMGAGSITSLAKTLPEALASFFLPNQTKVACR